jgi:hypothetical protein
MEGVPDLGPLAAWPGAGHHVLDCDPGRDEHVAIDRSHRDDAI